MGLVRASAVALGLALGSVAAPAWAAPPVELHAESVRGEITLLSEPRFAGRTTHVEFVEETFLSGDLTSPEDQPVLSRLSCVFAGSDNLVCHGDQVFTGTIEGVGTGTMTSKVRFRCSLITSECTGTTTATGGTDGLAGVRSRSTFSGRLGDGEVVDVTLWVLRP